MQQRLTLCLVFLISLITSCANQSHSNQGIQKKPVSDNTQSIDGKNDNTLRLKFPGGVRSILEDSKGNPPHVVRKHNEQAKIKTN